MCRESREEAACGFLGTSGKFSEGLAFERRLRLSWVAPDSKGAELGRGRAAGSSRRASFVHLAAAWGPDTGAGELGGDAWPAPLLGAHWYIPNGTHIGEVRAARRDIDERH